MLAIFKSKQPPALLFLEQFAPSGPWIVQAAGTRKPCFTFGPDTRAQAAKWFAKRGNTGFLTAQPLREINAREAQMADIAGTRHFTVIVPRAARSALNSFKPAPMACIVTPAGHVAIWRLTVAVPVSMALAMAETVAARLGAKPGALFVPLPDGLEKRADFIRPGNECKPGVFGSFTSGKAAPAADAGFEMAASVTAQDIAWLWPDVLPAGVLSLIAGEPGVGKSTLAAAIAAAVSCGGAWPTGQTIAPGGVIFCEGEDPRDTVTLPRLSAAGADLSAIVLGPVCDLSTSTGAIEKAAARLPLAPRLLVLSPIRSFFGLESYRGGEVRNRLAPLLAWALEHEVAVLGVSHPKQGKREFAGAQAWKEVARAGLFAERSEDGGRHVTLLKANQGPDDWRLNYRITGARAGNVSTSRVLWELETPASGAAAAPSKTIAKSVAQPMKRSKAGTAKAAPALQVDAAVAWLRQQFEADPVQHGPALKRAAAAAGISQGSLYRAAGTLDVVIAGAGGRAGKVWRLPRPE